MNTVLSGRTPTFSVPLLLLMVAGGIFVGILVPVSYTHLDVYKRQAHANPPVVHLGVRNRTDIDEQIGHHIHLVLLIGRCSVMALHPEHTACQLSIDTNKNQLQPGQDLFGDPAHTIDLDQSVRLDLSNDEADGIHVGVNHNTGSRGIRPGEMGDDVSRPVDPHLIAVPVSYTHLDVYKRQHPSCLQNGFLSTPFLAVADQHMAAAHGRRRRGGQESRHRAENASDLCILPEHTLAAQPNGTSLSAGIRGMYQVSFRKKLYKFHLRIRKTQQSFFRRTNDITSPFRNIRKSCLLYTSQAYSKKRS